MSETRPEEIAAAYHATMDALREDLARFQQDALKPGDPCPNCGGRSDVRLWGPVPHTEGCEDCAGTGRVL